MNTTQLFKEITTLLKDQGIEVRNVDYCGTAAADKHIEIEITTPTPQETRQFVNRLLETHYGNLKFRTTIFRSTAPPLESSSL